MTERGEGHTSAAADDEPLDFFSGPIKFTVLAACTVRAGPDSTTAKVGEYKKGDTVEIVNEATNSDGLKVYQTRTAPKGADSGGWVKLRTSKGKALLTLFAEPLDFSSGPVKFTVLAACTVRAGPDSTAAKVGEYKKGDTIEVSGEATSSDGLRVYQTDTAPKGGSGGGWVKLRTSKGKELLTLFAEPLDFANGPIRYVALAACTVRAGPDSTTAKVGEYKKGDTIEIVNEATNSDGLKVYQTRTAPKGADSGGWVKLRTSKGKELLSVRANDEPEPLDYSNGPVRCTVLAACTVRAGPDASSASVGQYKKGDAVEIVNEATNSDGLKARAPLMTQSAFLTTQSYSHLTKRPVRWEQVYQTVTAPKGADSGGWVKLRTSKGKALLSVRPVEQLGGAADPPEELRSWLRAQLSHRQDMAKNHDGNRLKNVRCSRTTRYLVANVQ
eukprot:COSAG03_NODE_1356_length_4267_cov_2.074376_3_plen_443_part_00